MFNLLFSALILAMVALLACGGEEPTSTPANTPVPASTAVPRPTATTAPTATPQATPTSAPTRPPAATATPASPMQAAAGEGIAPLSLDDRQALVSELSQAELACMRESGDPLGLLAALQAPDMASPEAVSELSLCLRDGTLLRLFLTGIIGPDGALSRESSDCIRAGFAGIDLRSAVLAGATGEGAGETGAARNLAISCLNEEEWAAAAPGLGLSLNYRDGLECLTRELGGPEDAAAALQVSEQGPSFALIAAAVECGLSESDLAALTAAPPAASATTRDAMGGDAMGVIAPLNLQDPVALMSELSEAELSCLGVTDPQELPQILGAAAIMPGGAEGLGQCLEDETLLRLFLTQSAGVTEPFSEESSACLRNGFADIDIGELMVPPTAEGDENAATTRAMTSIFITLSCLNEEEYQSVAPRMGMNPGERENLLCVMEQLGGPEGMSTTLQAGDEGAFFTILTAVADCELQLIQQPPSS